MSAWPGKFVIGLTGNIATGKSVVRKMLEHLGAYGIDADALGHRAIAKDAPGYQAVIDTFGRWILTPDGQIDRAKLAHVVFSDPDALVRLESIVHPLVRQAVDILIKRSLDPKARHEHGFSASARKCPATPGG
jgi:dephospho-CoA kinase